MLRSVQELHVLLVADEETEIEYGRITRRVRSEGPLIGTNPLWIAAASIRHGIPSSLPTHMFARVERLEVLGHR